jgi:hypothetical protein
MQPLQTSTTKKIQNKSLSIVIGIVGHNNSPVAELAAQLRKPSVTKIPGSHLDADSVPGRMTFSIKISSMKPDTIGVSPVPDKRLISITLFATKMKIAMSYGKGLRTEFRQKEICHAHRIHTSAHSKEKTRRG